MLDERLETEARALRAGEAAGQPESRRTARPASLTSPASGRTAAASCPPLNVDTLPAYARSLLRVPVPVVVTLAEKKQTLRKVLELAPGAIIQFDKSCVESLGLSIGERPVAQGQAVKVGDKFGIRVTSMILPEERFKPVRPGGS